MNSGASTPGGSPANHPDVLVLGGGLGATALVAALRGGGFTGSVTVVCGEDRMPYDRPPLSKELFDRDEPAGLAEQFSLSPGDAAWLTGRRATAITPAAGGFRVSATDAVGDVHSLDAPVVVVATGVRPVVPVEWSGVRTLSTWEDARALRAALAPGTTLAIVGAGWVGLELASAAAAAGVRVTVVDALDRPLGTVTPPGVGARIAGWLAAAGVAFVPGGATAAGAATVTLADGRVLDAAVVVAALGARPATAWLPAGWLTGTGHVLVDGVGAVRGAAGAFAIGDCTAVDGRADQHWNAAVAAAERCAAAILGHVPPPPRPSVVFSTMYGHSVDMVGRADPHADVIWREDTAGGWTALLTRDGALVAGVAVDRPRDVAALRRILARDRPRIDPGLAADAARPLTAAPA